MQNAIFDFKMQANNADNYCQLVNIVTLIFPVCVSRINELEIYKCKFSAKLISYFLSCVRFVKCKKQT